MRDPGAGVLEDVPVRLLHTLHQVSLFQGCASGQQQDVGEFLRELFQFLHTDADGESCGVCQVRTLDQFYCDVAGKNAMAVTNSL